MIPRIVTYSGIKNAYTHTVCFDASEPNRFAEFPHQKYDYEVIYNISCLFRLVNLLFRAIFICFVWFGVSHNLVFAVKSFHNANTRK